MSLRWTKTATWIAASFAAGSLLTAGIFVVPIWAGDSEDPWALHGNDPQILVAHRQLPSTGRALSGTLVHTDRCLYLELSEVSHNELRQEDPTYADVLPERGPVQSALVWPPGTRPTVDGDGRRGILLDGFIGSIGTTALFEGDQVWAESWVAIADPVTTRLTTANGTCPLPSKIITILVDRDRIEQREPTSAGLAAEARPAEGSVNRGAPGAAAPAG